MKQIRTLSDL